MRDAAVKWQNLYFVGINDISKNILIKDIYIDNKHTLAALNSLITMLNIPNKHKVRQLLIYLAQYLVNLYGSNPRYAFSHYSRASNKSTSCLGCSNGSSQIR